MFESRIESQIQSDPHHQHFHPTDLPDFRQLVGNPIWQLRRRFEFQIVRLSSDFLRSIFALYLELVSGASSGLFYVFGLLAGKIIILIGLRSQFLLRF